MEEEYMDTQDAVNELNRVDISDNLVDSTKDFGDSLVSYGDDSYEEDEGSNSFRGRGRGGFNSRGRGPPPAWMSGPPPPMRFRGRGYGPGGPPMRGRGFFRGRGGPRPYGNNGPNFDNNWGPMGPPPPGMMGGPPPGMMGGPPPFGPPPGMMPPGGPMGPPPNIMGQPPPYGGPPGMPPPNMPAPEIWVETKSEDGKFYYYHSRTRETTWTRPQDSPACKVITQADVEALATGSMTMDTSPNQVVPQLPQNVGMNNGMGGPGPMGMMPNGMMPPGVHGAPGNGVPPFMNQPPPWVKDTSQDQQMDDTTVVEVINDDIPPGESAPIAQSGPGGMVPGFPGSGQGFPGSGQGFPGSYPGWTPAGGPPAWAHWPPSMVGQMPPGIASSVPDSTTQIPDMGRDSSADIQTVMDSPSSVPEKKDTVIPPDLIALAAEWTTHKSPDGRAYYYHAVRQESVWEKPQCVEELEEYQAIILKEKGERFKREFEGKVVDLESDSEDQPAEGQSSSTEDRTPAVAVEQAVEQRQEEQQEKQEKEKEKAKQDRSRPISSTPIMGTPWCVVWTGEGSVFFYNSAAHSSVWERPAALLGRADVDRALAQPPQQLLDLQRKDREAAGISSTTGAAGAKAGSSGVAAADLKRVADSSSDDSPGTDAAKKAKPEDGEDKSKVVSSSLLGGGNIDLGAAAAMEAEVRAARERGALPHHQRLKAFLHMLHEKEVSAFSTWEKELHKIVFDPRYLMLNSKERRQVFDQYVRDRAEEERKEKKNRIAQKKTAFKALMEEAKLHSKSSFSEFSSKHSRDERYKGIEKARDRETCFNEHLADLRKREKEEKDKVREQVKTEFISMLKEKAIDRHLRWIEAKKKVDADPRYKVVESSMMREDYYKEYCKMVKEERKKDKDITKEKKRERSSAKKEKRDKDRTEKEPKDETKKNKKKDKGDDPRAEPLVQPEEVQPSSDGEAARAKEARAQASIKEREREVQRALATSLRDRDKEREYHKRDEAVQHFNALLADLVRNPDLNWREAKKQLKKDHRHGLAELLTKEDKERLFMQHTSTLASRRRDKLRTLLQERNISCTANWKDVKAMLADEPTAPAYSSASQMEREFRDYQRDKQSTAKTAMRQLLLETRSITHKSLSNVKESPNALQHVLDALKHDARYTALDHISEERQQIITSYLEELEKKGPPPPPTATEPSRRAKP